MKKDIVYVVCEQTKSGVESPTFDVLLVTRDKDKAIKKVQQNAKKLAKDYDIDLNNIDTDQWEVICNKPDNVEIYDYDYHEGFSTYIKAKTLN